MNTGAWQATVCVFTEWDNQATNTFLDQKSQYCQDDSSLQIDG